MWTLLKKKEHINVLEMTAAKYAILTCKINPRINGEHSCPVISYQNTEKIKQNFVSVEQRDLGIFTSKSNQDYLRESSRGT